VTPLELMEKLYGS